MLAFGAVPAHAQSIVGVVVEDSSLIPIGAVRVQLRTAGGSLVGTAQTDSMGSFTLPAEKAGKYQLHVAHPSYAELRSDTISLRHDEVIAVELRLAATAIAITPLIVQSRAKDRLFGFHDRSARGGFGAYVTRKEIDTRQGARVTALLREIPGVELIQTPESSRPLLETPGTTLTDTARAGVARGTTTMVTMRGGAGRCLPVVFMDGIAMQQFPQSGIDELLHTNNLEGVEVYRGLAGVPHQFQTGNTCGVVAFWTRDPPAAERRSLKRLLVAAGTAIAVGGIVAAFSSQ
jgi:hypothetical protein